MKSLPYGALAFRAILALMLIAVALRASTPQTGLVQSIPAPAPTPAHQAGDTGGDWPMYGHDPQHTGYNPDESLIGPRNVAQVVPRWQVAVGSSDNPSSSTPSVAHGLVYVGSSVPSGPNFFAFEATTGAPAWSADLHYMASCEKVGIGSTAAISGTLTYPASILGWSWKSPVT